MVYQVGNMAASVKRTKVVALGNANGQLKM
jgi:hypothetical protein